MARKSQGMEIDDAVFQSKIRKMAKRLKVDETEFVKQQGALYAFDLGKYTPPYANFPSGNISKLPLATNDDLNAGRGAVLDDCLNVFRAKPRGFIIFLKREFGAGMVSQKMTSKRGREYRVEYQAIGMNLYEMFKFHERMMRPSNGRTGYKKDINSMWVPRDLFDDYVEWRERNVGMAKAAFLRAGKMLNKKSRVKAPVEIRRLAKKSNGRGRIARTRKGPTAIIKARSPGLHHTFPHLRTAQKGRLTAMKTRLLYLTKQAGKKSGFKVR